MKKFTLIEVIVSIVVLGILAAVVVINILNLKKESITAAVNQNISILQTAVDEYYLKKDTYPIVNQDSLSLETPVLLDVDYLKKKGFLKTPLVEGNIPEVYYELDSFGTVWGSTEFKGVGITELSDSTFENKKVSVNISKNIHAYNIYEVNGYNLSSKNKLEDSLIADTEPSEFSKNKSYKVVENVEIQSFRDQVVEFDNIKNSEVLLVSGLDEYGLESAPAGNGGKFNFKPILSGEGTYEFEIAGDEMMYWIDFKTLEDKPGDSTITYRFKVQDANGVYKEYVDDYYSLEPSTGIIVEVVMKGDDKGNKPSLYDLKVIFKYKDEELPPAGLKTKPEPEFQDQCPAPSVDSTLNYLGEGDSSKGIYVYTFISKELDSLEELTPPKLAVSATVKLTNTYFMYSEDGSPYQKLEDPNKILSKDCMLVVYEVDVVATDKDDPKSGQSYPPKANPTPIDGFTCGNGAVDTDVANGIISYVFYVKAGQFVKNIDIPKTISGYVVKGVSMKYSYQGNDFEELLSYRNVTGEGCFNVIYKVSKLSGYPNNPPIPTYPPHTVSVCEGEECQVPLCEDECISNGPNCFREPCVKEKETTPENWCDLNKDAPACQTVQNCIEGFQECYPPVCTTDCLQSPPTSPNPNDTELLDEEWTTVDRLRFFGYGPENQLIRWYKAEHTDSINEAVSSAEISLSDSEDTRIVYRYAKSSGQNWSTEYVNFAETDYAANVLSIAYIQVKTAKLKEVKEDDYPKVLSMKFFNEKGYLDASMVTPTVVILPKKDNNLGREVFSDASNITWEYDAADPRNKKITEVEWGGDKRDKYPVGTYIVKIRVKNEVEIWSEWSTFKLNVLQEKPIAVMSVKAKDSGTLFTEKTQVITSMSASTDPDGDKIVSYEWKNKKEFYPIGKHTIELRVRDSEGYWSDWASKEIEVFKQPIRIFRLEGEDNVRFVQGGPYNRNVIYDGEGYSKGKASYTQISSTSRGNSANASFSFKGNGFDIKFYAANNVIITIVDLDKGTNHSINHYTKEGESTYSVRNLALGNYKVIVGIETYNYNLFTVDYIDVYSDDDTPVITRNSIRSVLNGSNESSVENNLLITKYNQLTRFRYTLLKDSFVKVDIVDEKGKVIRNLKKSEQLDGGSFPIYLVDWDGKDNSGKNVVSGTYFFQVTALGINKDNTTVFKETVVVENLRELLRIEGEDKVRFTHSGNSNTNEVRVNEAYSGGSAIFTRVLTTTNGNSASTQMNFTGTGFDIKFYNAANVLIRIVDKKTNTYIRQSSYNKAGESVFSVRDLPVGNYDLVLTVQTYTSNNFIVDYIDIYSSEDKPTVTLNAIKNVLSSGEESPANSTILKARANDSVRLKYVLYRNAEVQINVEDSTGKVVRKLQDSKELNGGSTPLHSITWDGKDNAGEYVPHGNYNIIVTAKGVYGKETTVFKQIVNVENIAPFKRIEGEDKNQLKQGGAYNYTVLYDSPSFSGGKASYTRLSSTSRGNSANAAFIFTGTGFDIKFHGTNNLRLMTYLKSGNSLTLSRENWHTQAGVSMYSVRNLPMGTYDVRLMIETYTSNFFYVDYIDLYNN